MARVLCRRLDLYPFHLVVKSFARGAVPKNYKEMTIPILLRANNINYETAPEILNNTGKSVVLWDNQFVKPDWSYGRTWTVYPTLENVKVISASKIAGFLSLSGVVATVGCMINNIMY